MRVAAVQWKARKGDYSSSLRRLVALCSDAATGSDLVVLPEMALTGYLFADAESARAVAVVVAAAGSATTRPFSP